MEVFETTVDNYIDFIKNLYSDEASYITNKLDNLMHITDQNLSLYKNTIQKLITIKDNDKTLVGGLLILPNTDKSTLFVSFFEALKNVDSAVDFMLNYIKEYAINLNCKKVVIGVDGHINYGIGFSLNSNKPSYAECYTKLYYNDYFKSLNEVSACSFYDTPNYILPLLQNDIERLNTKHKSKIIIQEAKFDSDFDNTLTRYTNINNNLFGKHKYYYQRTYAEDKELFTDLLPLLDNKNLLFATLNGEDVGYLFWLPDFNEFIEKDDKNPNDIIYNKFRQEKLFPNTSKVLEMASNRKYLREGITLRLFYHAINNANPNTKKIISSWIFEDNIKSTLMTKRYTRNEYQKYKVYEMIL